MQQRKNNVRRSLFATAALFGCAASLAGHANDRLDSAAHEFTSNKARNYALGATLPPPPQADSALLQSFLAVEPQARADRKANQSALTRAQVVSLYNTLFVPGNSAVMGWTGVGPSTCTAGTTNASFRQAILDRMNFYRQVSGLPVITFFATSDAAALQTQASALMQGANAWGVPGVNPHSPPNTWSCYTASGATAAGKSNLAKGFSGPSAIDAYMDDDGGGNEVVGHRRWILYPPLKKSFSGDVSGNGVSSANTLWVIQNSSDGTWGTRPATPNGIAWPPGGYVPFQALPDISNRWSFSWPGANMTNAVATVTKNGQSIAILGYDTRDNAGYGDASVVFRPNNISANGPFVSYSNPGAVDQDYVVTISGLTGGGAPSSVTYTVTVIDPAAAQVAAITGNATVANSGNAPAGTSICASPNRGVSCTSVDAAGQYNCSLPNGWTGTLHLQAGNTKRVAAQRFTAGVMSALSNQNFVAHEANVATTNFAFACNLDIDNNGINEAAIDGVMLLRKLSGFTGNAQSVPTSGVCAQRTADADKVAFLNAQNFDVDGVSGAQSLRDGLLLTRLMLGVPGSTAVQGTGITWNTTLRDQINAACGTSFP
ncbi:MAG: CAP domain-containing protein [Betaproteobacteria bacterium]|nr:MAG: CAP domain-containing protein [Betaproteobacteria bacterium]